MNALHGLLAYAEGLMTPRRMNDEDVEYRAGDDRRELNLSRAVLPIGYVWALILVGVGVVVYMVRLEGRLDSFEVLLKQNEKHQTELAEREERYRIQWEGKQALEISNAGLRTTSMELATQIAALRDENARLKRGQ